MDAPLLHHKTFAAVTGAQRLAESGHANTVEDIAVEAARLAHDPEHFSHVPQCCVSDTMCPSHVDHDRRNSSSANSPAFARV